MVLGPSGCGKSTLLRCINGLETIQAGDILLDGQSITKNQKDFHLVRQKIGMVFQSYELFPHLDVLQNLILGPTKAQGRPKEEEMCIRDRVFAGSVFPINDDAWSSRSYLKLLGQLLDWPPLH